VADVPSGLSLIPPQETKERKKTGLLIAENSQAADFSEFLSENYQDWAE
jgi:hypothetical protein